MTGVDLAHTDFAAWHRTPLCGDASSRRYTRLTQHARSAILMETPPQDRASHAAYLRIATILRAQGLCAPQILHDEGPQGWCIIEDLGPHDIASVLRDAPERESELYTVAVDALLSVRQITPPDDLIRLTPRVAGDMLAPTFSHYAPHLPDTAAHDLVAALEQAFETHLPVANTLSLRDYHAENLIWRDDRAGLDRVGLLDFQDAFVAPSAYDLASLLRDIRRPVALHVQRAMIAYFADQTGQSVQNVTRDVALLAVQRNLRILGVFAQLEANGRTGYARFIPTVEGLIRADATHPDLSPLVPWVDAVIASGQTNP